MIHIFDSFYFIFCSMETPASPRDLLLDYDYTHQDDNEHVHNTPPSPPVDARETSPPVGDLGGSHDKHVDTISDLPSSGAAIINAIAVLDAPLDSVNIVKHGSSSLDTSILASAVVSDSVVVSTKKAVENVIPGQWTDADGNLFFPASVLFKNTTAPSMAIIAPEADPEYAQPAPSSAEGISQADQSHDVCPSPAILVPASSLFTNLQYMDSPVWNLSSQSPVRDDVVVS
jgi:hypothetical protein